MENKRKINVKILIAIMLIILALIVAVIMLAKKDKKILEDISYIEIQVDNSGKDGLSMTDPLKIEDEDVIDEIKDIMRSKEQITMHSAGGFFESCPMLTIYQKNGEILTIVACDGFEMEGEPSGNIITISKKQDMSDKILYRVDKELGAYIEKLYDKNIDASKVGDYFIIYNGAEIEKKTGVQHIYDMEITPEANIKYNTTYYNYENGKYHGTLEGIFGEETYEGRSMVMTTRRIAISERYNAIPREYETITQIPTELIDISDYTTVDCQVIDLDGDGKKEYFVSYTIDYNANETADGKPVAKSGIMLFDNNYKKVANLVTLENGFWGNREEDKTFFELEDVEYIDIDNDGIMEAIIRIPRYEGSTISIIKYNNGKFEGEKDIKATLEP